MILTGSSKVDGQIVVNTTNKDIYYGLKNVVIDKNNAGIGDVVVYTGTPSVDNGIVTLSDYKIIAGSTASPSTTSGEGAWPKNGNTSYTIFGVIYGFEKGCAKIMAKNSFSRKWAQNSSSSVTDNSNTGLAESINGGSVLNGEPKPYGMGYDYTGGATIRLQNGRKATYCTMNVAKIKSTLGNSSITTMTDTNLVPNSAYWDSGSYRAVKKAVFDAYPKAVATYGNYDNYVKSMLPVGGGDSNDPFDSSRHIGYRNTSLLAKNNSGKGKVTNLISDSLWYPAATQCWYYDPNNPTVDQAGTSGTNNTHYGFYLPDMVDLRQMMIDSTIALINPILTNIGGSTQGTSSAWWSSLRFSTAFAWSYSGYGLSGGGAFWEALSVRPVALLKL